MSSNILRDSVLLSLFMSSNILSDSVLLSLFMTKFQGPRSNSFRDILLTSLKCSKFQRVITLEIFNGIH